MSGAAAAAAVKTNGNAAQPPPAAPAAATQQQAEADVGETKALADLLNDLPEPITAEEDGGEGGEGAAAGEGEQPEVRERPSSTRNADELALDAANDAKLFTDDALATPEGVKRAGEVLKTAQAALTRRTGMLDRFDSRLNKRARQLKADREQFAAVQESFNRQVEPTRQMAARAAECFQVLDPSSGATAKQRFAAIGLLACGDPSRGQEYYEEWSLGIAADGKVPAPPVDREARARLERLERERQEAAARERETASTREREQLEGGIRQRQEEIVTAARDEEAYPVLAAQLEEDPEAAGEVAEYATALMVDYHGRTGRLLAKERALDIIEKRLAKRVGAPARRAGLSPEHGSGAPTKTPRSPTSAVGKGKTVLPSSADRSTGVVREPTSLDERTRMNARDPELMDEIFGSRWREQRE